MLDPLRVKSRLALELKQIFIFSSLLLSLVNLSLLMVNELRLGVEF